MRRSLPRRGPEGGAELIEFALLMPLLMAMLLGIIEYGMMFSRMLSVQSATRDAARWAATPGIPMDEAPAEAVAMLREVGYTEVVRYEGRRRVSVPLPAPVSAGGAL